jgi:glyoxylase-like metal-dependent hydrolase (beta-lactamase superfamily II)
VSAPPAPGRGIHALAVPTPFAVGRVNCYLIDDDPLTLVDCGPNSGKALDELETGLREHGRRIEDLERIVITHQHLDHLGLVGILARRSGAEVCTLDLLAPVVERFGEHAESDDVMAEELMLRHGISEDVAAALRAVSRLARGWGGSAQVTRRLQAGGSVDFAGRSLQVHHRPGHSPSDTVFFDAADGTLIAGDHLLKSISSNPLISKPLDGSDPDGRPHALLSYMASLRATREMPVERVLPGHGDEFTGHAALIDERFAMHERRARKIHRLVAEPTSAHEIAHALWGGVAVTQAYLTLSEVLGHIDLLLERGQVRELDAGGILRYEAV